MCQLKELPWWITDCTRNRVYKTKDRKYNSIPTYFPVRYCNNCNKVWELPLAYGRDKEILYHCDFPTYRLKRET